MFASWKKRATLASVSPFACAVCLVLFLWAFLGTIDGPVAKLEAKSGHLLSQGANAVKTGDAIFLAPIRSEHFRQDPPPVHPSFLEFDFKQNLSRWPNISGDISRSPPSIFST